MASLPRILYAFSLFMYRLYTNRIGGGYSSRVRGHQREESSGAAMRRRRAGPWIASDHLCDPANFSKGVLLLLTSAPPASIQPWMAMTKCRWARPSLYAFPMLLLNVIVNLALYWNLFYHSCFKTILFSWSN